MIIICQAALSKKLIANSLILLIARLLFFQKLFEAREFFRRQVTRLDQTHHETLRRAAEHAINQIADRVPDHLMATHSRTVEVRLILERALDLALTLQHVK